MMRSLVIPCTITTLAISFLIFPVRATQNSTQSDDAGAKFTDNLFSDLAPLLALFGENVARQFLSQSLGWADCIIFSMAPLGILTAIVSAIRVGGPTWLRAVVGRATESRGTAELELMSSTSDSVCELWNGQAVSRVLGSPEVLELVFLRKDRTLQDPIPPSIMSFAESTRYPQEDPYYQLVTPEDKSDGEAIELLNLSGSPRQNMSNNFDVEDYEGYNCAPNISLNLRGEPDHQRELWTIAIVGTILQLCVLVYDGFITQTSWGEQNFKKGGSRPPNYSFPLTIVGTVTIIIGMLLCSHVVESSTCEERWEPRADQKLKLAWLQRGQVVNDETFGSYVIFADSSRRSQSVITSRVNRHVHANALSTLATVGTLTSLVGFVIQFMGLRGMHWSATIAQLMATGIMTVLRAFIRRRVIYNPDVKRAVEDYELDWMAREVADCMAFSLSPRKFEALNPPHIQDKGMAAEVVELRQILGDLSGWTSKVQSEATKLSRVIERLMELVPEGKVEQTDMEFSWRLPVWIEPRRSQCPGLQYIPVLLKRKKLSNIEKSWGKWRVDSTRIEAVLSLLMLHYREAETESATRPTVTPAAQGRLQRREDIETLHKTLRILDFPVYMDHVYAMSIYDWWIGRGTECFHLPGPVEKGAITSWGVLPHRIVGTVEAERRGVAVVSVTPLESICAQHILSKFLQQVRDFLPDFSGETKVRSMDRRKAGSFRILNTAVEQLMEVLTSNDFCTIEDAYMTVVPTIVERLPPIADSQADILNFAKARQDGGAHLQIDDIEFWLSYTSQWTARQGTRYSRENPLRNYVEAARAYFKTAQLHSAAANTESPSEATQKRFEQADAKLVRACNLVAWGVRRSHQLPDVFNEVEQLFRDILQWLTLREEGWRNSDIGVHRNSTHVKIYIGFSKILEQRMRRFRCLDDRGCAKIEELQLRGRDDDNSKSETDWNIMQQFLVEVDDRLRGGNLNTHAGWAQLISQAAHVDNEAAVDMLLEAIPDHLILGSQSQVTNKSSTYDLSTYPKGISVLQLLLQELSLRAPSRRLYLDVQDSTGETPLTQLAHHGQHKLCKLLLDYGADPNFKNATGKSPLFLACWNGHHSTVRVLIDYKAQVSTRYDGGNTCLHVAARRGCGDTLRHLLGIDEIRAYDMLLSDEFPFQNVDVQNTKGETAMHFAALTGSPEAIRYLARRGASVNRSTPKRMTPLAYAALNGHHEAIKALFDHGATLNDQLIEPLSEPGLFSSTDRFSSRTLEVAVLQRHVFVVSQLLGYGACPHSRCLRIAAGIGCDRIFKLVLEAYIMRTDNPRNPAAIKSVIESLAGNDAIRSAMLRIYIRSPQKVTILLAHKRSKGYDSIAPNEWGMCALSLAAANKNARVLKKLLDVLPPHHSLNSKTSGIITQCLNSVVHSGCDETLLAFVSAASTSELYSDWMPCMASIAIENGNSAVVNSLIKSGLDRNLLDLRYALECAAKNSHADLLKRMSKLGFPVASVAHEGSILHIAAKAGEDAVVAALVELGVDVNSPSGPNMWRPLQLAAQSGHLSTVKLLLKCGAITGHRNLYGWTAEFLAHVKGHNSLIEYFASLQPEYAPESSVENLYNPSRLSSDDPFTEIFEIMSAEDIAILPEQRRLETIIEEPSVGPASSSAAEVRLLAQTEPAIEVYPGQIFEMHVENVGPLPPIDLYPGAAFELPAQAPPAPGAPGPSGRIKWTLFRH